MRLLSGWSGDVNVSCILRHQGVQLILAFSWARLAILVADKGRGDVFISSVYSLSFLFLFLLCPSLSSPLLSLQFFSLSLGDDAKWPTRVEVSLNPNTINCAFLVLYMAFVLFLFVPRLSIFWCLGRAVLCDCGNSCQFLLNLFFLYICPLLRTIALCSRFSLCFFVFFENRPVALHFLDAFLVDRVLYIVFNIGGKFLFL